LNDLTRKHEAKVEVVSKSSSYNESLFRAGFEVLSSIQALLHDSTDEPARKAAMLVDASNQFYTLVPAMHPNPINDEGRLKEKVRTVPMDVLESEIMILYRGSHFKVLLHANLLGL
jgi:hypothetical protein